MARDDFAHLPLRPLPASLTSSASGTTCRRAPSKRVSSPLARPEDPETILAPPGASAPGVRVPQRSVYSRRSSQTETGPSK